MASDTFHWSCPLCCLVLLNSTTISLVFLSLSLSRHADAAVAVEQVFQNAQLTASKQSKVTRPQ